MTPIKLFEGGPPVVASLPEDVGDELARSKVVTAYRVGGGRWEMSAATKVGVATVAGLTVWIRAKVTVRRILWLLGYAKAPGWLRPSRATAKWQPSRLNTRYHVALRLAELILSDNAVDQTPGDVHVGGFLIDMAKVFEDFVTVALAGELTHRRGLCRAQPVHHLDADDQVTIQPDLVWYGQDQQLVLAVIDAKYKVERPPGYPNADLYQLLAYCTALELKDGHLVYAKGSAEAVTRRISHTGIAVHAHCIDLDRTDAELLDQMRALAERIATEAPTSAPTRCPH